MSRMDALKLLKINKATGSYEQETPHLLKVFEDLVKTMKHRVAVFSRAASRLGV